MTDNAEVAEHKAQITRARASHKTSEELAARHLKLRQSIHMLGCATCAFDMGPSWNDCTYPDPQDDSTNPVEWFVTASMPDRRNGGANCDHFRHARKGLTP